MSAVPDKLILFRVCCFSVLSCTIVFSESKWYTHY